MIACSDCGTLQFPGSLFCAECGNFLLEAITESARRALVSDPTMPLAPQTGSTAVKRLRFQITPQQHITLTLEGEIDVGRADEQGNIYPQLDLTAYQGAELGVSRLHATIQATPRGIVLIDRASTNGTYLNSYRLPPEKPYPLGNGDELRFGNLPLSVLFE